MAYEKSICSKHGKLLKNWDYCPYCGEKLEHVKIQPKPKVRCVDCKLLDPLDSYCRNSGYIRREREREMSRNCAKFKPLEETPNA
jgi:hypothetical protein